MKKFLVCAALVWLAALRAAGQAAGAPAGGAPPLPFVLGVDAGAEVSRLLKSQGNRERAWGAYLAGAHGLKEHAPLVVGLLEDPSVAAGGWEESLVRQAALDALIRLEADVPAEQLLPLYTSSPDEVVILLSRAPKGGERELLALFAEEAPDERWAAVGNLLTEARALGFAARLLRELKVVASVYVYDSEGDRGYGGGSGGGFGGGCGAAQRPEGFPPVGYYTLSLSGVRGAVVFAPGRHTVYYLRTLSAGGCGGGYGRWLTRDERRVEYLADLLRATEAELGLDARPFREVICKDARQCRRALVALRDEIVRAHEQTLLRLLGEGLLGPAEASELSPDITFDLNDSRDRKTFPLPDKLGGVKVVSYGADTDPPADSAEPEPGGDAPGSPR